MAELTQAAADRLLGLDKFAEDKKHRRYPPIGGKMEVSLLSEDDHEKFVLNITRGRFLQAKVSYQTRARSTIILARIDLGTSALHRNPDGEMVGSPHIHLYREGFGDKWAFKIDSDTVSNIGFDIPGVEADTKQWFDSFLSFCKIKADNIVDWPSGDLL